LDSNPRRYCASNHEGTLWTLIEVVDRERSFGSFAEEVVAVSTSPVVTEVAICHSLSSRPTADGDRVDAALVLPDYQTGLGLVLIDQDPVGEQWVVDVFVLFLSRLTVTIRPVAACIQTVRALLRAGRSSSTESVDVFTTTSTSDVRHLHNVLL
jgi:hypothetical protein